MSALTILSIFIFLVLLLVFIEYRNEKKYQQERRAKRQKTTPDTKTEPSQKQKKTTSKPKDEPKPKRKLKPEPEVKPEPVVEVKPEPEIKEEPKPEPKKEVPAETKKLPEANYPPFTHVRLVEMGLSDEEAKEFVAELIPQIEVEIPLIETAIEANDFHQAERITHSIKGSATNLGTGGVSDLLSDFNTYLKSGTDIDISKAYLKHLLHYTNELKAQYS